MKGTPGLILAIGLGLTGALCNWFYVNQKGKELAHIGFVGIRGDATIKQGDKFEEQHFERVTVPKKHAGKLEALAVRYEDLQTVIGMKATREYDNASGEILLAQDLKTPPPELKLNPATNERAMWIPVDSKTLVTSLVVPGEDQVSFIIPRFQTAATPASPSSAGGNPTGANSQTQMPEHFRPGGNVGSGAAQTVIAGEPEILGPFTVLAVGNRLGSQEVFRAARASQVQENVVAISVNVRRTESGGEELDDRAKLLWNRLRQANFQGIGILLHPRGSGTGRATSKK